MPDRITSEDVQKFRALVGRIFSDEAFARQLEQNPEQALEQAGFRLDEEQREALARRKGVRVAMGDDLLAAPFVRPVVATLAGTLPTVQVVVSSVALRPGAGAEDA